MHGVDGIVDALPGGYVDGGGAVGAAAVGECGGFVGVAFVDGDDGVETQG